MPVFSNYYCSRKLVIVGYDFHSEGGAWRSIYRYFRFCEARGEKVMLIDRRKQGTFRQLLMAVLFSPKVFFNGMGTFLRWEGIIACLLRKDIMIYLHDTEYVIKSYARNSPIKFCFMKWILARNPILVVSRQMEGYYRRDLGVKRCHVVREAVALPELPEFDSGYRHIVMVGSLDERKGVTLFSEVARMAREQELNWRFHWIGALASNSLGELSPDVRWWGWQDSPKNFVRKADVFFLSSLDDPLPLAGLEAISLGKRCLVFRRTGIAELIDGVDGCAVFEEYSPTVALHHLEKIMNQEPNAVRLREISVQDVSLLTFVERLNKITDC